MTENKTTYDVGGAIPANIEAFKNKACTLPAHDNDFKSPTPDDVKALIEFQNWSQRDVALIVGASWNHKGSATVRKWKMAADHPSSRKINYAAWRLLLLCAGIVTIEETIPD